MTTKQNAVDDLLFAPLDIPGLVAKLEFAEEDITRATREQASLFLEAARYRVKTMRRRIQMETAYESSLASAAMKLRQAKRVSENGEKKKQLTEPAIKELVRMNPGVVQARKAFERSLVYEEWSKLLVEAYKQRRDACRILAEIMGAESHAQARSLAAEGEQLNLRVMRRKVAAKYPGQEEG